MRRYGSSIASARVADASAQAADASAQVANAAERVDDGSAPGGDGSSRVFNYVIAEGFDTIECSRGVAQPGSAPALGAGGRRFESGRPDHSS